MVAVGVHGHGRIHRLQETVSVDASDEETTLVQSFRTFRARADAHRREGMSHAGEEAALLGQGAAVAHHRKGVHLQAVVVVEAQRLMLDDTWVELEARGLETLAATRMAAVENGHVVFLSHGVDGVEETEEVLLRVDVLPFLPPLTSADMRTPAHKCAARATPKASEKNQSRMKSVSKTPSSSRKTPHTSKKERRSSSGATAPKERQSEMTESMEKSPVAQVDRSTTKKKGKFC